LEIGSLSISLTVLAFDVYGTRVLVPQRVEPGHLQGLRPVSVKPVKTSGALTEGSSAFVAALSLLPEADRHLLEKVVAWAEELQRLGYVKLQPTHLL
jgi:hypothetical protein